jgi:hypothetical protein
MFTFMYSYGYVCSILGILFHCVVLCIVCAYICTVFMPQRVTPIAINKVYNFIYHKQNSHYRLHSIPRNSSKFEEQSRSIFSHF